MDPVATLALVELAPDGTRSPVCAQIWRPRHDERSSWACPVLVSTINETPRNIYGEDSMQALCLAVRFVHLMLQSVVERGSRLLNSEDDEDFPLQTYFGATTSKG